MKNRNLPYYNNCVHWPQADVNRRGGLCDMIAENRTISRRTFLKHVDRAYQHELEDALGYAPHAKQGLTMASDWAVSYHRSYLHGRTVYYFRHSAIEYVFTQQ